MLGEPETEVDVGDLFGHASQLSTDYYNVFEEEFETVFGTMGKFIIKKQLNDLTKGNDITEDKLPFIINKLSESVVDVVGPDAARELKRSLRRKCGLPV
jgi:hypothetical protein